ncbi:inhibitor of nuclear factor kappa-B kinase subunit beta [Atheta coriaria]|uniref:inhibitor of nuclear factor kappa-B kinase subunit beta n=1 Tax=Dalotia coriaria TaxID=877792 RepID=UPI0031F35473
MEEVTSLGDWLKVCTLGSGSFGVVTLWRHRSSNDMVAIKKCRFDKPQSIEDKQRARWTQEVDFMRNVQHPNIVGYKQLPSNFLAQLERYNLSRLPLLPMEYCSGGNLRRLLLQSKHACGLREPDVRRVLDDIAAAVSHLHRCQITHRDIKPENVVLQHGAGGRITYKLIDLGYAKDMSLLMSFVGTLAYTAPEIFKNEKYNHSVDYWSFGIMAYEVCCGKHPFLPKVPPVQRFEMIAKKGPRDICVYQASGNKIIYTDKIFEHNHISACLRTHLEDWLGSMLQYKSTERGVTQSGANVFTVLKSILDKQILHVFAVYNYTHHYYEINAATKLHHLQYFLQESTGLLPSDQLIVTSSTNLSKADFYNRLLSNNLNASLITDLGLSSQSTLILFKRNEYINPRKLILPPAVKSLINMSEEIPWERLNVLTSQAVHYIEQETNKMHTISMVVNELFEFLRVILSGQDGLVRGMKEAGRKALMMVEFCSQMNSDCWYDRSKVNAIKNQRKQMWRVRELIENVNSAIVRFYKSRTRTRLLRVSMDRVVQWMDGLDINSIYDEALKLMNIGNQKTSINASGISRIIFKCLKTCTEIQQDEMIVHHFNLCFKVLREHNKLTRWMRALTEHLAVATVDLLDAQKQLSRSDGQTLRAENAMSAGSSERTIDIQGDALLNNGDIHQETPDCSQEDGLPTVDDLVKDNRIQRCRMQEVLEELLAMHKKYAIHVEEFVQYIDNITSTD